MKYTKKPIPVEISEPWYRGNDKLPVLTLDYAPWAMANTSWYHVGNCIKCRADVDQHGWVGTLEGGHIVCPGDRIVTGVEGEHYPIKPHIFEKTYEEAKDESTRM